jgi:hypothetical protein
MKRTYLLILLSILLFSHHHPGGANDASRMAFIESMLNRGETWIDNSFYMDPTDRVYVNGHFYSDKPPLMALYSAAMLFPFNLFLEFSPGAAAPFFYYLAVVTSAGFALLGILFLMTRLHRNMGVSSQVAGWCIAGTLLGTALLPFAFTYNTHVVVALLMFSVLTLLFRYRENRARHVQVYAGLLTGISWLVHPFAASFMALSTTGYFLSKSFASCMRYGMVLLMVIGLGMGLNQWLYGSFTPYYFTPELSMYGKTKISKQSSWINNPVIPGLTAERIEKRLRQLNFSEEKITESLGKFYAHQKEIKNPFKFMYHKFIAYDYLTFNPLVFFCLILLIRSLFLRGTPYRPEVVWILASVILVYAGSIYLRAEPGTSFGNRYLIVLLPMILSGASLVLNQEKDLPVFKFMFGISLGMMLPGVLGPWENPNPFFIKINFILSALICSIVFLSFVSSRVRDRLYKGILIFEGKRILYGVLLILWCAVETLLYIVK